ncbi:nucleotidyltransferase [Qipengyuania sp. YG27]|uniref:Nucleotidyltransferase n=1 Tax=Qipengyuania mesophila TaxID=2867246 RepID=A0ABS7JSM0_9SPHN|nr:nucleotidyltransferase [Qipengyuania mesophila]MBX7500645.1 nucleotidyltransferase [Qipengyuania mesophila]
MRFTEEQFKRFAAPPSQTERDKMQNAERAIKNAIAASDKLKARSVRVFAQGSYRNRVNVRADSDVDIAVVCSNTFFWDGPDGSTRETFGIVPATYDFETFRAELGQALIDYFGQSAVDAGDKAFDIKANTYRVDADAAPFFDHRRYDDSGRFLEGVEMRTRKGRRIINWPDQHYDNGVAKNDRTGRSYKGCVRILKTLRYAMLADEIPSADGTSSFLMECLIWNVPDQYLTYGSWSQSMREALAYLFNNTMTYEKCEEWGEVSELKYLFRGSQAWTWESAHKFLSDCWDYVGFE